MIYYDENLRRYKPCTHYITYTRGQEEFSQFVGNEGLDWWNNFEEMWEDMSILKVDEVTLSPEQEERYNLILEYNIPEGYQAEVEEYVENNTFPAYKNHILQAIETDTNEKNLGAEVARLRINNIQKEAIIGGLGKQIANLKIDIMKLKGGDN